jgi:deaminated glutathione amidase
MRAAVVQLNSTGDKRRNLATAERLVRAAAADGAGLVALPEKWNLLTTGEELAAGAEPLDGPSLSAARDWARQLGIHLLAGSIAERGDEKAFNTSVLIGPEGEDLAVYRKIHMFDVIAGGVEYRESEHEEAGNEIVTASLGGAAPDGGDLTVGMSVCYDLRFPELFRILAVRGARVLAVPSAFTLTTGRDHWEVLLRARAIENQAFVLAPNQVGEAPPNYSSYGRSTIVDPWGVVLATAPDGECFVAADLDLEGQERVRRSLPSLANRRPQAYEPLNEMTAVRMRPNDTARIRPRPGVPRSAATRKPSRARPAWSSTSPTSRSFRSGLFAWPRLAEASA